MRPLFKAGIGLLLIVGFMPVSGQDTIHIRVKDALEGTPLAFVYYQCTDTALSGLSDASGNIILTIAKGLRPHIQLKRALYRPYFFNADSSELSVQMLRYAYLPEPDTVHHTAQRIWKLAIGARSVHHPPLMPPHTVLTYQKLTLGSRYPQRMDGFLRRRVRTLGYDWPAYTIPYNLLLAEHNGEKSLYNRFLYTEKILHSTISGVDRPEALGVPSFLQPISLYTRTLLIGPGVYQSPLHRSSIHSYEVQCIDTLFFESDTCFVLAVQPLPNQNLHEKVRGLIWVSATSWAIRAAWLDPVVQGNTRYAFYLESKQWTPHWWYPHRILTRLEKPIVSGEALFIEGNSYQVLEAPVFRTLQPTAHHYETAVSFADNTADTGAIRRPPDLPLTSLDSSTLKWFAKVGHIKNLAKYLQVSQRLMDGYVPWGVVDIPIQSLVRFNDFEGARLGLGAVTNNSFSRRFEWGGAFGYGLLDNRWKGHLTGAILHPGGLHTPLRVTLKNDLQEAGGTSWLLYRPQFGSETLRSVRLLMFDKQRSIDANTQWHVLPYNDLLAGIHYTESTPLYRYAWAETDRLQYEWVAWYLEWRFSPGQRFVSFQSGRYPLKSLFPVLNARYTRGSASTVVDFHRIDLWIKHSYKVVGLAAFHNQIRVGQLIGKAPYVLLFNGTGSFSEWSAVSRNSFETMGFNEFTMNRIASWHISVQLGRLPLAYRSRWTKPELEWLHNAGWGMLDQPEQHVGISVQDIRKGYLETGILASNLFLIPVGAFDVGLGVGAFLRYGAYAHAKGVDNVAVKLSAAIVL